MKLLISILLAFTTSFVAYATDVNAKTVFTDGHFVTDVDYYVETPFDSLSMVLDELYEGMQNRPTQDLKWAWKGLGRNKSVDGDLNLRENGVKFNPSTNEYILNLLVGMTSDENPSQFQVEGKLLDSKRPSMHLVQLAITKKIKILNDANFVVTATPYGRNRSKLHVKGSIKFGWFFNMFFTTSRYASILEWRIDGFTKNVKERAEEKMVSNQEK